MPSIPAQDRFGRLSELFREACRRDPAGRSLLLEETRHEDPELATELASLLDADDSATDTRFLQPLPGVASAVRRVAEEVEAETTGDGSAPGTGVDADGPGTAAPDEDLAGLRLGDFELVRLIARGGMGAVYEGRQARPERRVAVKLLRDGLASERRRARFRLEAEVLGRLQHPGIAAVHAAGTAGDRPWLAMEFVEDARPITHHAEDTRLDVRGRVGLLRQVADAVRHAHQRGVIHRDLKPANVLVDGEGRVKVIDFGVARARAAAGGPAAPTMAGELVGTLAWMSPEQCGGDPEAVDARSDVYGLGLVLHALLTGRQPVPVDGLSLAEAVRRVTRNGPASLDDVAPELDPDLRCIARVATALDPADRYQSVDALVGDLDRWRRGEPITARPPGPVRRLRLFVRRHRGLSALVATGAAAAAAIAILVLAFTVRLAEEGRATRAALDRSERMLSFLTDVLASGSDRHSDSPTRSFDDALALASARLPIEFDTDPRAELELRQAIGLSWQTQGDVRRALEEFDRTVELAEGLPDVAPETLALAIGHRAKAYYDLEQWDRALAEYRRAVELYRAAPGASASSRLAAEQSVAILEAKAGDAGASERLRAMLDVARTEIGGGSFRAADLREALAITLVDAGRPGEAEIRLRQAIADFDARLAGPHPQRINARNNLGWALVNQGRFDEAIEVIDEALAMSVELFGPAHPRSTWIRGTRLDALVRSGLVGGEITTAEVEAEARSLLRDRLDTLGPRSRAVALSEQLLWRILLEDGRAAEALPLAESALDRLVEVLGPDHPEAARAAQMVALTLGRLGRRDDAIAMLVQARKLVELSTGAESRATALAHNELGVALAGAGRWDDARAAFAAALELYDLGDTPDDPERIKAMGNVGRCLLELGRHAEARPVLEDALVRARRVWEPGAPPRVNVEASLGEVLAGLGARAAARPLLEAALPELERRYPPGHPRLARMRAVLGADEDVDTSAGAEAG